MNPIDAPQTADVIQHGESIRTTKPPSAGHKYYTEFDSKIKNERAMTIETLDMKLQFLK